MKIRYDHDGRVDLSASIELPMSARRLWAEIADLPRFAAHDFFHAKFELPQGKLEAGAPLAILHRYLGVTIRRVGRVLRYEAGVGYSFSDLSCRSRSAAFPHVFTYAIEPIDQQSARLCLSVRGRLRRPRLVPHVIVKAWLWAVFAQIVAAVELELLLCCPHDRLSKYPSNVVCDAAPR